MPKVSVILSTHNDELYIQQAVDSILNQTFTDFEFIILDDASTDKTPDILHKYRDPRIKIITNAQNKGIPASVNVGLAQAKGEYIARMDGDDVSALERFAKQVTFLDANPRIGVVGTQRKYLDTAGNFYNCNIRVHTTHNLIAWRVFMGASFWNPSTMIRRNVLDSVNGYNPIYFYASDLELWTRLLFVTRFANLDEDLLYYRVHDSNISQNWRKYPTVPPPRTLLASRLINESVPDTRFNLITSILYSNKRVTHFVANQLIQFLIKLHACLVNSDVFDGYPDDVTQELTQNIVKISNQAPERITAAINEIIKPYYKLLSKRTNGNHTSDVKKFITDRKSGNKPRL